MKHYLYLTLLFTDPLSHFKDLIMSEYIKFTNFSYNLALKYLLITYSCSFMTIFHFPGDDSPFQVGLRIKLCKYLLI